MRGEPDTFWAKLHRDDATGVVHEWHPLVDHAADVAAVAEALLRLPVWRRRLSALALRELGDTDVARLCVLAALHDIGKFNLGFQAKGRPELGPTAGHVREALGALIQTSGPLSCLDELGSWGDATTDLMITAICHHGRPYNPCSPDAATWQASWWTARGGLDPVAGIRELLERCRSWFPTAFQGSSELLSAAPSAFSHAFAGLVMLADWIGSDSRFFPSSEDHSDRFDFARAQARSAITHLGLDIPLAARVDVGGRNPFVRISPPGYVPRAVQNAMLDLPRDAGGSITILESETGSGKTEAVLARFISLFEAGLVDGLYFALPTRSAATQMHERVYEAACRAFAHPPPVVLAVPGYLRVDDVEGSRLAPFDVQWPDEGRFRFRAWAAEAPKRYLAGCLVVGTIDQVLLSCLMVSHAHLRATALLRHLLVVDEVHASDTYMTAILEVVLRRHRDAGGHAVLLSATLGGEARARLCRPLAASEMPTWDEVSRTPYPLVTHRGDLDLNRPVGNGSRDRRISLSTRPWMEDPENIAAKAIEVARGGARVLVIRNTVTDCIGTQLALEAEARASGAAEVLFTCAHVPAPHHALFARVDRRALDVALEDRFGKDCKPGGCVVVATQTVQQSLDLDADYLLTDLCPADVLLQRLGRLHRHNRARPPGFEAPSALVVVPSRRDLGTLIGEGGRPRSHHGLGSVYSDLRPVEATWQTIEAEPEWVVPRMNRQIVERAVHSRRLEEVATRGGSDWEAHAAHVTGTSRGHRRQAELNIVDWTRSYAEISFPRVSDQRILTRLGEGDRRVRFTDPLLGPFGRRVDEVVLRSWWTTGVPDEAEPQAVTTSAGRTSFRFGGRMFVYDRHGLRPDGASRNDIEEGDGP